MLYRNWQCSNSKKENKKKKTLGIRLHGLTLLCFLQGDRGYDGPKGSRGPLGIGLKGDKVGLHVARTADIWMCKAVKLCCKDLTA